MAKKKALFLLLFLIGLYFFWGCSKASAAEPEEYGINDPNKVRMSFEVICGECAFQYKIEIQGNGNTTCVIRPLGNHPEKQTQLVLDKANVKDFISQYAKIDFFKFNYAPLTEPLGVIMDGAEITLSYQYNQQCRTIKYGGIKTDCKTHHHCLPVEGADNLAQLQKMYDNITRQVDYLDKLKNYKNLSQGELAEQFSALSSPLPEYSGIINPKAFVPVIMEIITQKEMRDSIGQDAASALEKLTGQKLPGDWWDCQKWLKWWDANKSSYEKN